MSINIEDSTVPGTFKCVQSSQIFYCWCLSREVIRCTIIPLPPTPVIAHERSGLALAWWRSALDAREHHRGISNVPSTPHLHTRCCDRFRKRRLLLKALPVVLTRGQIWGPLISPSRPLLISCALWASFPKSSLPLLSHWYRWPFSISSATDLVLFLLLPTGLLISAGPAAPGWKCFLTPWCPPTLTPHSTGE